MAPNINPNDDEVTCDTCGWTGVVRDLVPNYARMSDECPACGSIRWSYDPVDYDVPYSGGCRE